MNEQVFNDKVASYCELDETIKEMTKQRDRLRDEICAYMDENDVDKCSVDGYTLTRSISHRTTVNEDMMLTIIKGWDTISNDVIKTKEYVDTDVLADMTYNGLVSPTQLKELEPCRKVKEVVTLRPTKKGG